MNGGPFRLSDRAQEQAFFTGVFFDGKTSLRQPVSLEFADRCLLLRADGSCRIGVTQDLRLADPSSSAPLLLTFPDGAHCELPYSPLLLQRLLLAGVPVHRASAWVSQMEGGRHLVATSLAFLLAALVAFYVWLLPVAAETGAALVPASVQARFGTVALEQMEAGWFAPSSLPVQQQQAIQQRFEQLLGERKNGYTLHIRKFRLGPNALALPGNIIVLADELVALVDGDLDAISGILAHELGHLKFRHGLRQVIQATALSAVGSALIGDYSSILAALPATLGALRYNRTFETEADVHALDVLCKQGMDPARTALFFDRMVTGPAGQVEKLIPEYLMTHPGSAQRAEFFRSGC
jgi:Zn-dependent protease with chaperone function